MGMRQSLPSGPAIRSRLCCHDATRPVRQSFLCARDIALEGIASLRELDLDAVKLYGGSFFNARNRDGAFSLNTIFPLARLGGGVDA